MMSNPAYVVDQPEFKANLRVQPFQSNFVDAIRMTRRRQCAVSKRQQKSRHSHFFWTGAGLAAGQGTVPAQAHHFGERSDHYGRGL
jgi:hypothetical protein